MDGCHYGYVLVLGDVKNIRKGVDVKKIVCEIQGVSALLMHAFPLQPVEGLEKMAPAEQAEASAYRDPESKML